MKYIAEFREPAVAGRILDEIRRTVSRPWVIMEICGGHTHAIMKNGIDQLLPAEVELVHGPGCPVCVTPIAVIDRAVDIAARHGVIFASFGDMLRVPGSEKDLFTVRSGGGDVRIVYSPLEAVELARRNPDREVVFFAVGFETTAPATAMAILQARREKLLNFSLLASHRLVPPAIRSLLASPANRVQGYLAPGHVCTVTGWRDYEPIAARYRVPVVPTGFEPADILEGILMVVRQLEQGRHAVENQYRRSVTREGNAAAQEAMRQVFAVSDGRWRGLDVLPESSLRIRDTFAPFDAERKFTVQDIATRESALCMGGLVLTGSKKPYECAAFGRQCTPAHPLGATMVSSEGACAAYYAYQCRRNEA